MYLLRKSTQLVFEADETKSSGEGISAHRASFLAPASPDFDCYLRDELLRVKLWVAVTIFSYQSRMYRHLREGLCGLR
jgi:hypothetical protein